MGTGWLIPDHIREDELGFLARWGYPVARETADPLGRFPIDPQAFLLYAGAAEKLNHLDAARQALLQYDAISDSDAEARASRIATLFLRVGSRADVKSR